MPSTLQGIPQRSRHPCVKHRFSVYRRSIYRLLGFALLCSTAMLPLAKAQSNSRGAEIILSPGFQPNPQVFHYIAGGSNPAYELTDNTLDCTGYIYDAPDHRLYLQSAFDYLRIHVDSSVDTTLVIYGHPYGSWICDDDSDGWNPVIAGEQWRAGWYDIYVGTYWQEDFGSDYSLTISEVNPNRIPTLPPPPRDPPPATTPPTITPPPSTPPSTDGSTTSTETCTVSWTCQRALETYLDLREACEPQFIHHRLADCERSQQLYRAYVQCISDAQGVVTIHLVHCD